MWQSAPSSDGSHISHLLTPLVFNRHILKTSKVESATFIVSVVIRIETWTSEHGRDKRDR